MIKEAWTVCLGEKERPDDGRSISRNVAEKHYDLRHDKLRKQYKYN